MSKIPFPVDWYLTPGTAFELTVPVKPKPKPKFCVFCSIDPPVYFLINSEINDFIAEREHLNEQQLPIPKSELDIRLKKDSYLDCSAIFTNFSNAELKGKVQADRSCWMGKLSNELLEKVVEIVKSSVTIRPYEKQLILKGLSNDTP